MTRRRRVRRDETDDEGWRDERMKRLVVSCSCVAYSRTGGVGEAGRGVRTIRRRCNHL